MARYDLTTPAGRFKAGWDFTLGDHAFLRLTFTNAHWISTEMVRTNQPWPFQLRWWRDQGIRTVVNLRGGFDSAYYAIERDACARLGLTMVDAPMGSREVPSVARVRHARQVFETIAYPALMHCKSGADRAGIMSVLYRHFRLGQPISEAREELGLRTLHVRQGKTGVLDHVFDKYVAEIEPRGIGFMEWVESPDYDPVAIKAEFHASWIGTLLTERLLRRE